MGLSSTADEHKKVCVAVIEGQIPDLSADISVQRFHR